MAIPLADIRNGKYADDVSNNTIISATDGNHGWLMVSDTSWPGYIDPPRDVLSGNAGRD